MGRDCHVLLTVALSGQLQSQMDTGGGGVASAICMGLTLRGQVVVGHFEFEDLSVALCVQANAVCMKDFLVSVISVVLPLLYGA